MRRSNRPRNLGLQKGIPLGKRARLCPQYRRSTYSLQSFAGMTLVFALALSLFGNCADLRSPSSEYIGICDIPEEASGFQGGDGTAESPFVICNYDQFNRVRDDMTAHYRLEQDIDGRDGWMDDDGMSASRLRAL